MCTQLLILSLKQVLNFWNRCLFSCSAASLQIFHTSVAFLIRCLYILFKARFYSSTNPSSTFPCSYLAIRQVAMWQKCQYYWVNRFAKCKSSKKWKHLRVSEDKEQSYNDPKPKSEIPCISRWTKIDFKQHIGHVYMSEYEVQMTITDSQKESGQNAYPWGQNKGRSIRK